MHTVATCTRSVAAAAAAIADAQLWHAAATSTKRPRHRRTRRFAVEEAGRRSRPLLLLVAEPELTTNLNPDYERADLEVELQVLNQTRRAMDSTSAGRVGTIIMMPLPKQLH